MCNKISNKNFKNILHILLGAVVIFYMSLPLPNAFDML